MFNKIFSNNEISALAYEANQLSNAGYEAEAQMIRREPLSTAKFAAALRDAFASLFSRDLPAALAYEAGQNAAAGYLPETCSDDHRPSFFEPTAWLNKPAAETKAFTQLACSEC